MRQIVRNLISFMVLITLLTGCSTNGEKVLKGVSSGVAIVPPQTNGIIESIQSGNPSYAVLKNVDIVKKNSNGEGHIHITKKTLNVNLPSGHFVSPNHWQSNGDTLDLFIGDNLTVMNGHITDSHTYDSDFAGVVKSVSSNKMVIQKVLYAKTSDNYAMNYTNQTVIIRLAPYTHVMLNGSKKTKMSEIKKGDAVLFILIGPPSDYIATQITDFHSIRAAGWDMVNP